MLSHVLLGQPTQQKIQSQALNHTVLLQGSLLTWRERHATIKGPHVNEIIWLLCILKHLAT